MKTPPILVTDTSKTKLSKSSLVTVPRTYPNGQVAHHIVAMLADDYHLMPTAVRTIIAVSNTPPAIAD